MRKTDYLKSLVVSALAVVLGGSPALADFGASFQGLGLPGSWFESRAQDVSADGSVVVGYGHSSTTYEAFRWTQSGGTVGLGDLPGSSSNIDSVAYGVSADGSVVVGYATPFMWEAFRWTQSGGMVGLGNLAGGGAESYANGVSADGSVVVGYGRSASGYEAFRWTQAGGMVGLGDLAGGSVYSVARGVSADGSVVVGYSHSASGREAFRWTQAGGMVGLGDLPGSDFESVADDVSADGSVVVGYGHSNSSSPLEAFRWTQAGGMVGLGDLHGGNSLESRAYAVSADGSVVVGYGESGPWGGAFIWDQANGMRSLQDVLTGDYGLALTGFAALTAAFGISADGLTIVGVGMNLSGQYEAWRATLGEPVPVPGAVLLGVLGLSFAGWRLKRHGALSNRRKNRSAWHYASRCPRGMAKSLSPSCTASRPL